MLLHLIAYLVNPLLSLRIPLKHQVTLLPHISFLHFAFLIYFWYSSLTILMSCITHSKWFLFILFVTQSSDHLSLSHYLRLGSNFGSHKLCQDQPICMLSLNRISYLMFWSHFVLPTHSNIHPIFHVLCFFNRNKCLYLYQKKERMCPDQSSLNYI